MKKIAAISENKIADFSHSWQFRDESIEVVNYGWRPRPKKTIKAVNSGCFIMLATHAKMRADIGIIPHLAIADGRFLQLAFLPQILDQQQPDWRERTLIINSDSIAGRLALFTLLRETDKISISGKAAQNISEYLFAKYGFITESKQNGYPLKELALPTAIETEQGVISVDVAEAVLAASINHYPAFEPAYLKKLLAAAKKQQFYPSSAAAVIKLPSR